MRKMRMTLIVLTVFALTTGFGFFGSKKEKKTARDGAQETVQTKSQEKDRDTSKKEEPKKGDEKEKQLTDEEKKKEEERKLALQNQIGGGGKARGAAEQMETVKNQQAQTAPVTIPATPQTNPLRAPAPQTTNPSDASNAIKAGEAAQKANETAHAIENASKYSGSGWR